MSGSWRYLLVPCLAGMLLAGPKQAPAGANIDARIDALEQQASVMLDEGYACGSDRAARLAYDALDAVLSYRHQVGSHGAHPAFDREDAGRYALAVGSARVAGAYTVMETACPRMAE